MRLDKLQAEATEALSRAGIDNARQEARWLVAETAGIPVGDLFTSDSTELIPSLVEEIRSRVERRTTGEPLQYILGTVDFHGIELEIGPGVLIPRPETELLVELALEKYPRHGAICDLCTGSGAVVLALAKSLPHETQLLGIDISEDALTYAERNRAALGLAHVQLVRSDLFAATSPDATFSLVTANPPYIAPAEYDELPRDVHDFEPRQALWAAEDGLAVLRRIARESKPHLSSGAWVLCEIGCTQGAEAQRAFREEGYTDISVAQDYAALDRIVSARFSHTTET